MKDLQPEMGNLWPDAVQVQGLNRGDMDREWGIDILKQYKGEWGMATKKSKSAKRIKLVPLWPGDFTATHALVALSVMLNIALVTVLIAMEKTNVLDDVVVKRGTEVLCSDEYQQDTLNADAKALIKFSCAESDARQYFLQGYNDYRKSINLEPVQPGTKQF